MCYKMQDKEERGAPDPEWLIARSRPRSKVLPHLQQEYISIDPPSPLSAETKMVIVALGRGLGLKYVACWMCGGPEGHGLCFRGCRLMRYWRRRGERVGAGLELVEDCFCWNLAAVAPTSWSWHSRRSLADSGFEGWGSPRTSRSSTALARHSPWPRVEELTASACCRFSLDSCKMAVLPLSTTVRTRVSSW